MSIRLMCAATLAFAAMIGCEKKEDVSKTLGNAADKAKAAGDAAKDTAAKTADAAKSTIDAAAASASTWIAETVNKQWPEAKKLLDEAGKKVASLTGENKTKAEGLFKDLTAQVPTIEEAVTKLKAATGADATKMLGEAKTLFDGWMSKLGDLKGLVGIK
mgnify:CR=1 FL=1